MHCTHHTLEIITCIFYLGWRFENSYLQTSNISHTLVGNKIVHHSNVVGAITRRCCSNYIFILDLTPGLNGLGRDNCKARQETFKCWDFVTYTRGLTVALRAYKHFLNGSQRSHPLYSLLWPHITWLQIIISSCMHMWWSSLHVINTLRPRQNDHHFTIVFFNKND